MKNCCELRRTVAFDFDGVIHSYKSGWQGADIIPDEPVPGIKNIIDDLTSMGYEVVIYSTRCNTQNGVEAVKRWLSKYNIKVFDVCCDKPPAICYIDDRAIHFDGNTETLVDQITRFRSWIDFR